MTLPKVKRYGQASQVFVHVTVGPGAENRSPSPSETDGFLSKQEQDMESLVSGGGGSVGTTQEQFLQEQDAHVQILLGGGTSKTYLMEEIVGTKVVLGDRLRLTTFTRRKRNAIWKPVVHEFILSSAKEMSQRINAALSNDKQRPKNLRIFINPFGGKGKARQHFESVRWLFDTANISLHATETTHAGHASEMAKSENLDEYQGIVVFGGDGLINEVINGMHSRQDGKRTVIGCMPSGSTNALVWSQHGNGDMSTAALHIILGDQCTLDIGRIDHNNQKMSMSNFLSYGFFGDVAKMSEHYRFLGPARYDLCGFLNLMRRRSYNVSLEYEPAREGFDFKPCRANCTHCAHSQFRARRLSAQKSETRKLVNGKFKAVSLALVSCINAKTKTGVAPEAHLADGNFILILVRKCSLLRMLRYLITVSGKSNPSKLSWVEHIPCSAVRLRPASEDTKTSVWNCDGEVLEELELEAKVDIGAITVFARGIEPHGTNTKRPVAVPTRDSPPPAPCMHVTDPIIL
eukprot:m.13312 g.13312  ORF g.13312 m.13312 type:complete len:518 (+) comp4831_c0_seq2:168-1721(+)